MEGRGRGPARRREATSHTRGGEGAGGLVPGCDTSRVVWSGGVRGGQGAGSGRWWMRWRHGGGAFAAGALLRHRETHAR